MLPENLSMHVITLAILSVSLTPVVAVGQLRSVTQGPPNAAPAPSSAGPSIADYNAMVEESRRRADADMARWRQEQDAKLAQWRADAEARRRANALSFTDFFANQRARQNSLIGTYNDHVGGIVTRDMFRDEVYVEEPAWTNGTYWPPEEYVTDAEAQAIRDRLNQRDAFLRTIRARNAQAEIDARHEQSRREAEYQRQMEAEKRRLFFSKRDSQAAVLKTLIGTAPAMASGAGPSTLALLAGPQTAAAAPPAAVAGGQTQSAMSFSATGSAHPYPGTTMQHLVTPASPSATDLARAAYDAVVPVKDEDALDFGQVGEKMDEYVSKARAWLSAAVRGRPITADNAIETSRVLSTDAVLAHLRAVVTRSSDDVETSAEKKAAILDWMRQRVDQQTRPPE